MFGEMRIPPPNRISPTTTTASTSVSTTASTITSTTASPKTVPTPKPGPPLAIIISLVILVVLNIVATVAAIVYHMRKQSKSAPRHVDGESTDTSSLLFPIATNSTASSAQSNATVCAN